MPASNPAVLGPALATLPRSLAAFDENMEAYRAMYPAISRALYGGNTKILACTPERTAYSNYDQAADGFVLCDVGGGVSEVFVPAALVCGALACSDVGVGQRMLDLAMAAGALEVMVRTGINADNLDMGTGESAYRGVLLHIDTNQLLSLDLIKALEGMPIDGSDLFVGRVGTSVVWSNPKHVVDGGSQLLFVLNMDESKPKKTHNSVPTTERYLSWSCAGRFRDLKVCLVPRSADSAVVLEAADEMLSKNESTCKLVCSLQLRTQFAKTRAASSKRKRVALVAVLEDSADEMEPASP